MRLILKITLVYAVISLLVFLVGAYINYKLVSREIDAEQRYYLDDRLTHMEKWLTKHPLKRKFEKYKTIITPLDSNAVAKAPRYTDTLVLHEQLNRIEPHVMLDVTKKIGEKNYRVILYDLIIESDDIEDAVQESMIKTYLILIAAVMLISFIVSYYLLRPFNETLAAIRTFSLADPKQMNLPHSSTVEFRRLVRFLEQMERKLKKDYQSLKEFSENASHEMQTPLAVARGKLELLLESPNLADEELQLISQAQRALTQLSKVGNALGFLAKIENHEFASKEAVDMSVLVAGYLEDFAELVSLKNITIIQKIEPDVKVLANPNLMAALVSNLLSNAIRHNKGDEISVNLSNSDFEVSNIGDPFEGNPELLFERFRKGSEHPESSGLGLSIVKKICDEHQFGVKYLIREETHLLKVDFNHLKTE